MLTGTLDDFTLADVLRLVASARRTGSLDVARDAGTGRLWFRYGTIAGARPGYSRRGSAGTTAEAIEDLTFDLMRWDSGEFSWDPGADDAAAAEAEVEVEGLLREVARRLDELDEIKTLVPSEEAVLAWAPQPPEGAVQINITPAEWRVLVLVDGHRPVRAIAAAAGLDDLGAMKVLFGLATAGLVEAVAEPSGAPIPSEDVSDTADMTEVSDMSDTSPEETRAVGLAPDAVAADEDPFLTELLPADAGAASFSVEPPVLPAFEEATSVDRSTAARELAGLFDAGDLTGGFGGPGALAPPAPPAVPRRVEDDDQVTRGLISRLIDGVKGL
jgi:hypothetical protein